MTLCIAALCKDDGQDRIVVSADRRSEVAWAGGNVANKFDWGSPGLMALIAGDESKARDLLVTCYQTIDDTLNLATVGQQINQVAAAHKAKLVDRHVRTRLGISFDRFLTQGATEIPAELRNRVFNEIAELTFECDVMLTGFVNDCPVIFCVNDDCTVDDFQNFATIGSGSLIAESALFQREQTERVSLARTLYNVYEATRLGTIAPGVGETTEFVVLGPNPTGHKNPSLGLIRASGLTMLKETFEEFGPKKLVADPDLRQDMFWAIPEQSNVEPS